MCLCLVTQLCPTLCDPMDCSMLGSSVRGILQARILEWVAISFWLTLLMGWLKCDVNKTQIVGSVCAVSTCCHHHRPRFLTDKCCGLPGNWTQPASLDQEDPPEKKMSTHSSILAWRIPRTEDPGRLQSTGSQRVRHY